MRINGFTLIGRKGSDYYFCDSVFDHSDKHRDLAGATGSVVRPVSAEEWEWAGDRENVAERYEDHYREINGQTRYDSDFDEADFMAWIDKAIRIDGIGHLMFDNSDGPNASAAFDELGIDHEYTDCSGGGRIFGNWSGCDGCEGFDEVFDRKALVAIQALEAGAVSADYAAKVVFR